MPSAAPAEDQEAPKANLTSIIGRRWRFLLLILFLLVGGGLVFLFLNLGDTDEDASAGEENSVEKNEEVIEDSGIDLLIVPVRRFAVPLISGDHDVLGYMWVDLAFEVDGPQNQSYVAARLPALRDAFLRDLNARQTTRTDRPGALNFDLLQERLEAVTKKTVGQERVLKVRITNAIRVPE